MRERKLTFGRDTSTNLDIGFFDDHSLLNRLTTSASVLGGEHPFPVCIREAVDRDDTDAGLVVTAVSRTKANAPFRLLGVSCCIINGTRGRG